MYEGKFNLKAGAFQDAANAVKKEKQFIQPDAPKIASVSSDNEVFQDRNRELMKQMMKLIYSKLYLWLRFKGKCLYIFLQCCVSTLKFTDNWKLKGYEETIQHVSLNKLCNIYIV